VIAITKKGDRTHFACGTQDGESGRISAACPGVPEVQVARLLRKELTMEDSQRYRVVAWWSSGRTGLAKSNSAPNAIHFTAPPEFGGLEGRWTPEDLLLSAVASCYTTTFRALAEYSKLEYADLEIEVEGTIRKTDSGYSFNEIVIRPNLTISTEGEQVLALRSLQKAKAVCLVSRALSVEQKFEPRVHVVGESRVEFSQTLPVG
jgi:peroxiredoxin-like protein